MVYAISVNQYDNWLNIRPKMMGNNLRYPLGSSGIVNNENTSRVFFDELAEKVDNYE